MLNSSHSHNNSHSHNSNNNNLLNNSHHNLNSQLVRRLSKKVFHRMRLLPKPRLTVNTSKTTIDTCNRLANRHRFQAQLLPSHNWANSQARWATCTQDLIHSKLAMLACPTIHTEWQVPPIHSVKLPTPTSILNTNNNNNNNRPRPALAKI